MKADPVTDKGRDAVARVVDAACVLFARQGIRATTLDQVGALSGTGRGQLYLWFSGKADLVTDVVAQQFQRVLAAQHPLLTSMATAADVRAWSQQAVEQFAADDPVRCPVGSLVHELAEQDTTARDALRRGFDQWRTLLEDGMRRVANCRELAPGNTPEGAAAALLATYQGGILLAAAAGDVAVLQAALNTVTAGLLRVTG